MSEYYPAEVRQRLHGDATTEQIREGWVDGPPTPAGPVALSDPDPAWAERAADEMGRIAAALGDVCRSIEHVGSTSVPGLVAKPIIDLDLLVDDTADESRYVPALETAGYRLVLREPWWHGHRMLVPGVGGVHLHVFPVGAAEPIRHVLFRDWLRSHPDDRDLYAATKLRLAAETVENPEDYNLAKNPVIDEIYERIFAS